MLRSCSRGDGDHQSLILFTLRNRGVYLPWQKKARRSGAGGSWPGRRGGGRGMGGDREVVGWKWDREVGCGGEGTKL